MKRKFYFMAGLAAIAMLFAACSNLGDDTTSVNPNKTARFGSDQELTLSFDKSSFIIERNIYPGDWSDWDQDYSDDDLASKVYYVLTGYTVDSTTATTKTLDSSVFKNSADKTLSYEEFPYAKLMKSEAKVSIKPLIWYFTLTAYATAITSSDGEVTNTDACLVGTAWADMTTGARTVVFDMKPAPKGTTAVGTAEMGLTFTPPDTFDKMTYGFYNESDTTPGTPDFSSPAMDSSSGTAKTTVVTLTKIANASEVDATEGDEFVLNDGTNDVITSAKSKNEVDGYTYTYVLKTDASGTLKPLIVNKLTAGTYWFKAEFYDNQNKRIAVYIEKYVIDGSNTSTGDIELLEKVFNSAPQNIDNLSLTYTFNGIEFDSKPGIAAHQLFKDGDTVQSTYTATLKWTDVADNEAGYEIWLKVFGDADAITDTPTDVILSTRTDATKLAEYGLVAAQLQAGLNECQLTLATGKRYRISVRAFNSWSKGTTDTDIPNDYDDTYDAKAASQGYDRFVPYEPRNDTTTPGADNLTFGLYTIDYELNGGAVKQTGAKTTASTVTHYIVPYIYMEQNLLVGATGMAESYPEIRRSGYTFVGWNELYGATGWPINGNGGGYNPNKYYYTDPGLETKVTEESGVFGAQGNVTNTDATVVLDSIMIDASKNKRDAPSGKGGKNTAATPSYLATYSWTIPVWAKVESDEVKFYKDESGTMGTDLVDVPVYAVVSPTRAEIKAHADAATGVKCTYSNVMLSEGELTNTDYKNRQVFASWETPLAFAVKLPKRPDPKLTKQAAAGDPLVYDIGDEIEINVTNSQLSNVVFTVYKDDGTLSITDLFTDSSVIQTKNINDDGNGNLTWKTKVVSTPAAAGDYTYDAMTYYVKITATYTYPADPTNSLSGGTDIVEGYIFIRLKN